MVHFKNIQTPLTIDKEITIFNVSDVSANKMFNIISKLRNQSKISQLESENDFYICWIILVSASIIQHLKKCN